MPNLVRNAGKLFVKKGSIPKPRYYQNSMGLIRNDGKISSFNINSPMYESGSAAGSRSPRLKGVRGGNFAGQTPKAWTPPTGKYSSSRSNKFAGQTPKVWKPPAGKYGSSRSNQYKGQVPKVWNPSAPLKANLPNAPISTTGSYNRIRLNNGFGTDSRLLDNMVNRTASRRDVNRRSAYPRSARTTSGNLLLDATKPGNSFLGSIGATSGALSNNMFHNLSKTGAMGRAFRGTVQSSAIGGVGGAGMAYLQGNDPWEGAKTGAIRGAMVGAGYQGLKAATSAQSSFKGVKGIQDNLGQIGRGLKATYGAHTVKGQAALRNNGQMSNQLKRILMANVDKRIAEQVLLK